MRISLLLTATIDPKRTPTVQRLDPQVRLADYRRAARAFGAIRGLHSIVLTENSGWPKYDLESLFQNSLISSKVRIIACEPVDDSRLSTGGKSIGDLSMMIQALASDTSLSESDMILKVSGRNILSNAQQIIASIQDTEIDVYANTRSHFTWAETVCFAATPHFLVNYLFPLEDRIQEPDVYIEHVMANAIHRAIADGGKWRPLPYYPHIYGIRGGNGLPYHYGWLREKSRDLKHLLYKKMVGF